jgi:putative sterol carrier protein
MDYFKILNEYKELNSISTDDINRIFKLLSDLLNQNSKLQDFIKGKDVSIKIQIIEFESFYLQIRDGLVEYNNQFFSKPDFTIIADLSTIGDLLLGKLDPIESFFSEKYSVKGDLYYMISFFEIMEYINVNILKRDEKKPKVVLDATSLKKLFDVYARGSTVVDPMHVPLFFEILTAFANNNSKAKELLSSEDLIIQMNIINVGHYFIRIVDTKFGWAIGDAPNPNIKFEMGFKTSAEVIFERDPINAFMRGEIKVAVGENDWFKVFIIKDLTDLLLEFLKI